MLFNQVQCWRGDGGFDVDNGSGELGWDAGIIHLDTCYM